MSRRPLRQRTKTDGVGPGRQAQRLRQQAEIIPGNLLVDYIRRLAQRIELHGDGSRRVFPVHGDMFVAKAQAIQVSEDLIP